MSCKYKYNNTWYSKEELKSILLKERGILPDGKLVKPEIKKYQDFSLNKNYDNFNIGADSYQIKYYNNDWELGVEKYLKNGKEISDIEYGKAQSLYQKQDTRKQPTQTKENTTSIESVKSKVLSDRPKNISELKEGGEGFLI